MSTTNIKNEVGKLVQLQDIDSGIFAHKKELAGHPRILKDIQASLETFKNKLKNLEETKQKLLLKQKDREIELGTKEENIKKSQAQLGQLKTNKDYQTKLTEIEGFKADKSLIEEEILQLMDEIDKLKALIDTEKTVVADEEKKSQAQISSLTNRSQEIEAQLQNSTGKRKILSDSIDKKIFESYEHILHGKDGLALVRVENNSCQGCYMHVPPQVINEIKMHDRLITCEICARILYLEEDVTA
ncbi:MAG: C4-type zinc ribbon domain-containing protein [Candidatus Omnitrophota bacterium]